MMTDQDFSKEFLRIFNPDVSKYVEHNILGYIRTVKAKLTPEIIEAMLRKGSGKELSYFSKEGLIDYFGLDIDDHKYGGWNNKKPTSILENRFDLAKKIIGKKPSLLFRSPRGIHAYWFLIQPISSTILIFNLKKLFEGMKHFEVLPTNKHSLKVPKSDRFLNANLEECNFSGFEPLTRYSIEDIFRNGFTNEIKDIEKHGTLKKEHHTSLSLEKLEQSLMPFKDGQTNDVYIKLVVKYKMEGLDENEAYERFEKLINDSPSYTGDLLNSLEDRIKSSYKNLSRIGLVQMKSLADLYREPQIKKAIDELIIKAGLDMPKRIRMKKSIIRFLLNIISWKNAQDKIYSKNITAHYWDSLYPSAWTKHDEGYYPLPYSLLRKWNKHYNRPLKLLKDYRVLVESPYNYSTTLKLCKFYRINIECGDNNDKPHVASLKKVPQRFK